MPKKRKKDWKGRGYQRRFEDSDLEWLAKRFEKQSELDPDLTLEVFAFQHAVQPELIRRFITTDDRFPNGNSLMLWHGTTADRAQAILAEGFRCLGNSRKIWFTRRQNYASGVAKNRSQRRKSPPAVLRCVIDLGKYKEFERVGPDIYAFEHTNIDKKVVRSVISSDEVVTDRSKQSKKPKPRPEKGTVDSIDVIITNTSGKLGVVYWLNAYLEMNGEAPVDENHTVVESAWGWIEAEYADGREEPISNAEMLAQVRLNLNYA